MKKIFSILFIFLAIILISCNKSYKITFEDYDGKIIKETKANSINNIEYPDDPTRDGYVFVGWDNDFSKLNKDIRTKALYTIEEEYEFITKLNGFIPSDNSYYEIKQPYKKSLLLKDSRKFDLELAKLSLAISYTNSNSSSMDYVLKQLDFDNIIYTGYDKTGIDNVTFTLSHKKIDDYDLILITSIGSNYSKEWANNFVVGEKGNHNGFTNSANVVYNKLNDYIKNYNKENVRLWLTGYSRGGGIINLLADKLLREKYISQSKMYVYTYEAPKGILDKNYIRYENVFNIINSQDIVTKVIPSKMGFTRCGIDIDIYNENIKEYLLDFNSSFNLDDFKETTSYSNQEEFIDCLLDIITNKNDKFDVSNRKNYYNNLEESLVYLLEILMERPNNTFDYLGENFKNKSRTDILNLISKENELYLFIKELSETLNYSYDDEKLIKACKSMQLFISSRLISILANIIPGSQNFNRIVMNHASESIYVLLEKYNGAIN